MEHLKRGRAGTGSNLLPHQQSGAALTGQSILSGGSDPAQGQSEEAVTLPILQVRNYEMLENLDDIPKPHWEIKEVNGHLKSLFTPQNGCLPCVSLLEHKWLLSAGGSLTTNIVGSRGGVCTFLVQHQVHDRPMVFKKVSAKIEKPLS